mmetsp:Transcript_22435/g.29079  ORF Transcript_22435/g.29079 Transcript_22435/m.29079 type:complete len:301 (-) Transcript_22435:238-1140(-)
MAFIARIVRLSVILRLFDGVRIVRGSSSYSYTVLDEKDLRYATRKYSYSYVTLEPSADESRTKNGSPTLYSLYSYSYVGLLKSNASSYSYSYTAALNLYDAENATTKNSTENVTDNVIENTIVPTMQPILTNLSRNASKIITVEPTTVPTISYFVNNTQILETSPTLKPTFQQIEPTITPSAARQEPTYIPTAIPSVVPTLIPSFVPTISDDDDLSANMGSYRYTKLIFSILGILFILIAFWMGCCSRTESDASHLQVRNGNNRSNALQDTKYMRAQEDEWSLSPSDEDLNDENSGIELI